MSTEPAAPPESSGPDTTSRDTALPQETPNPPFLIFCKEGPELRAGASTADPVDASRAAARDGREVTSAQPRCSSWREHPEAIAQLHGLWPARGKLTGPGSMMSGPANWHTNNLNPVMTSLRDPSGPFAGCKPGAHRAKSTPPVEKIDPFGPPPAVAWTCYRRPLPWAAVHSGTGPGYPQLGSVFTAAQSSASSSGQGVVALLARSFYRGLLWPLR
ncbi:DUF4913 domain-containing protein [Streptomyces sp. NPDC048277]|uniref:DUF4913 domain-containing protein n=1 Tax=Streptomyces sp. NPDC048277 TaxID=3155027 RepID=UPI0033E2BC66